MQLVLTQDVDKLGKRGDVVSVADGFGRNYLLPQQMALHATPGNLKQVEHEKVRWAKKEAKDKGDAVILAREITRLSLTISRKVGENDHLYGSVTSQDIAEAMARDGFEIDKRKLELPEPIRCLGDFSVSVRLHREVVAQVAVRVVKE